jgi:hypothetical protein
VRPTGKWCRISGTLRATILSRSHWRQECWQVPVFCSARRWGPY